MMNVHEVAVLSLSYTCGVRWVGMASNQTGGDQAGAGWSSG